MIALSAGERVLNTADDFIDVAHALMAGTAGEKLEFLFRLHD